MEQRLPRKPTIHHHTVARTHVTYKTGKSTSSWTKPAPWCLQERVVYAKWFIRHVIVNHSIFVDECGYNIWTAGSHGRAGMGERAYRQVCGQRGRNVTVALPISPINGLVFHSAFLGGKNRNRFNDFLSQAMLNLDPNEGAPAHNNPTITGSDSELMTFRPKNPMIFMLNQYQNRHH